MKLNELIKYLQEIEKTSPNLECYTAIDDEGNGYNKVFYEPSIYFVDKEDIKSNIIETIYTKEELKEEGESLKDYVKICILN